MEAPEKVYITDYGSEIRYNWHPERLAVKDIEYIRKDVLIEKVTSYIQQHWVWNTKIIEDFKNYMED